MLVASIRASSAVELCRHRQTRQQIVVSGVSWPRRRACPCLPDDEISSTQCVDEQPGVLRATRRVERERAGSACEVGDLLATNERHPSKQLDGTGNGSVDGVLNPVATEQSFGEQVDARSL